MTTTPSLVRLTTDEVTTLRELMRDVQTGVATYYARTANPEDLGDAVRTFVAKAQTLNELLASEIADKASYSALFKPSAATTRHPSAGIVEAVKYARNLSQHVLHLVKPREDVMIGGSLGLRTYAFWEDVPAEKHALLRAGTQKLGPLYDAHLRGKEVVSTMLPVLRFYAEVNPELVHRDERGEWTGFPLMSLPQVSAPLHPEEPTDNEAAWRWLNDRAPSGDARVVCAQLSVNGVRYLAGFTFVGRLSFAPFVETVAQVQKDIAGGYPYLLGDVANNSDGVTDRYPRSQGAVLQSRTEINRWAMPLTPIEKASDWCNYSDVDTWLGVHRIEDPSLLPPFVAYPVRRSRRLNALVPD